MQKKSYDPIERIARVGRIGSLTSDKQIPLLSLLIHGRRRNVTIAILLGLIGGLVLLASYLASSIVLTFMGLGLILWSVISLYATQQRLVPEEVFKSASLASMSSIQTLVGSLGYQGRFIFFHPRSLEGLRKGYIFIAKDEDAGLPLEAQQTATRMFFDKPEGVLIAAPNQDLLDLVEKKLGGNFATMELNYLKQKLAKVLAEDLALVESVEIEQKEMTFDISLAGKLTADICGTARSNEKGARHFGCPICTTFALLLSKLTSSPIVIEQNSGTKDRIRTIYRRLEK